MYYMLIIVSLSGGALTTNQVPLTNAHTKESCEMIGRKGAEVMKQSSDNVDFLCIEVKK